MSSEAVALWTGGGGEACESAWRVSLVSVVSNASIAILLVRLAGFLLCGGGILTLCASVAASWGKVGLVYWETFLLTVVLPPALFAAAGFALWALAGPVGRRLARGLDSGER